MLDVFAVATAFLAALLVTWAMRHAGIIDRPNDRSNHESPTPRGGGLGILAGFFAGLVLTPALSPASGAMLAGLALCAGAAGAIGLLDDLLTLSERLKFVALTVLGLAVAALTGPVTNLGADLPWIVGLLGSALWVFTTANAVNFMDGSDGLIAATLIPASLVLALIGGPETMLACLALGAALAGFAVWNAPLVRTRGVVFAGDAGALAAAVVFAGLALRVAATGPAGTAWLAPLLILPLLGDVLLTMAARVKAGEPVFSAHRAHAYQLLIRMGMSHRRVALVWAVLGMGSGLLALVGAAGPAVVKFAVFAIGAAGFAVFHRVVRKRAAAAGEDIRR